jgi:hypothetical protein
MKISIMYLLTRAMLITLVTTAPLLSYGYEVNLTVEGQSNEAVNDEENILPEFIRWIDKNGQTTLHYISGKRIYRLDCNYNQLIDFVEAVGINPSSIPLFKVVPHGSNYRDYYEEIGIRLEYPSEQSNTPIESPRLSCSGKEMYLKLGNPSKNIEAGVSKGGHTGVYIGFKNAGQNKERGYLYRVGCWELLPALGLTMEKADIIQETDISSSLTRWSSDDSHYLKCINRNDIDLSQVTLRAYSLPDNEEIKDEIVYEYGEQVAIQFEAEGAVEVKRDNPTFVEIDNTCSPWLTLQLNGLTDVQGRPDQATLEEGCELKVVYKWFDDLPYKSKSNEKILRFKFGPKPSLMWADYVPVNVTVSPAEMFHQVFTVVDPVRFETGKPSVDIDITGEGCKSWLKVKREDERIEVVGIPATFNLGSGNHCVVKVSALRQDEDVSDALVHEMTVLVKQKPLEIRAEGLASGSSFTAPEVPKFLGMLSTPAEDDQGQQITPRFREYKFKLGTIQVIQEGVPIDFTGKVNLTSNSCPWLYVTKEPQSYVKEVLLRGDVPLNHLIINIVGKKEYTYCNENLTCDFSVSLPVDPVQTGQTEGIESSFTLIFEPTSCPSAEELLENRNNEREGAGR